MHLNNMNKITDVRHPWFLSFSFGRALQNSAINTTGGGNMDVTYKGSSDKAANESLFEAKYSY